jgi:membrane-bound lytic murein transglycosylase F
LKRHPRLHINLKLAGGFFALLLFLIGYGEWQKAKERKRQIDLPQIHAQGELRVLTLYSPSSYFIYRDKEMGYEYELCALMANDLGLHLKMIVAPNLFALFQMLKNGMGDLIAYNVPVTMESKSDFQYCGREFLTHQVLIQRKKAAADMVQGVTDLVGKTVVVHEDSRYYSRLNSLNQELGGGIHIEPLPYDSLSVEDLIGLVSSGKIDYTVADNNIAQFNQTFYPNINTAVPISFSQHASWAVRKTSPKLAQAVDEWFRQNMNTSRYQSISKRYFSSGKNTGSARKGLFPMKEGQISYFDELFRKYAQQIGWDWQLLAAIAYQESEFDPSAVNWTGASGLMQIMPKTARAMGVRRDSLFDPDHNVKAAARLLHHYEGLLSFIHNDEQRLRFTLASYNCGIGHIQDARELTRKYGGNSFVWKNNVEKYVRLKSLPEYYEDKVCRQGYLRGSETVAFVSDVWTRYQSYLKKTTHHRSEVERAPRKKKHRAR